MPPSAGLAAGRSSDADEDASEGTCGDESGYQSCSDGREGAYSRRWESDEMVACQIYSQGEQVRQGTDAKDSEVVWTYQTEAKL